MRKLQHAKSCFTIKETAKYLSTVFKEDIGVADVLGFALDGYLTVSVDFTSGTYATRVYPDSVQALMEQEENLKYEIKENDVDFPDSEVGTIDGIWDLLMIGNVVFDLQERRKELIDEREPDVWSADVLPRVGPGGICFVKNRKVYK